MKWSEDETFQFVNLYKEYECLWNKCSIQYRNKNLRKAAEAELVEKVGKEGFGIAELKQKIKNLRCTYNQECTKIKKAKKSGAGAADVYVPSLKWFKMMEGILKDANGAEASIVVS